MAKYLFIYHGAKAPEGEEAQQKAMAAWMSWMEGIGAALVDGGAPVGKSKTVSASGTVDDGGANPVAGYSIVEADSHAAAARMAEGCPVHADGGSVEVAEILPM